jgi:hypothetical protein
MINAQPRPEVEAQLNNPANRYLCWRQLEDGTYVAMIPLIFTVAIVTDVDPYGYARRYCYNNPALAMSEFRALVDQDSEPVGWIATR